MHKLEIVDKQIHQNVKVSAQNVLENNANVHMSHIVVTEFSDVAQYYPIFFSKDSDTGQFQPVALFGLAVDENIYQASGLWRKCYLPLKIQSQPFYLIKNETQHEHNDHVRLAIDINDLRVQEEHGEALFIDAKTTGYLQQQVAILSELTKGFVQNHAFISALLRHDLLESVTLDIQYKDGQQHKLNGLYTINQTMLEKVPSSIQKEFEQQGYVSLISAVLLSVSHVSTLIEIKNTLIN
ncbi:SapC family protein [Paraglaciecola sp.]|uniref:SapC family protein n=1 Tax=Paraglaciecola sp. TaxID=1920173 RepID=UPI0030F3E5A0